jgi:hypothetical protein
MKLELVLTMTVGEYDAMCKQGVLENPLTLEDSIVAFLCRSTTSQEHVCGEIGSKNMTFKISTELFKKVEK